MQRLGMEEGVPNRAQDGDQANRARAEAGRSAELLRPPSTSSNTTT
jgi:hypothetical protein